MKHWKLSSRDFKPICNLRWKIEIEDTKKRGKERVTLESTRHFLIYVFWFFLGGGGGGYVWVPGLNWWILKNEVNSTLALKFVRYNSLITHFSQWCVNLWMINNKVILVMGFKSELVKKNDDICYEIYCSITFFFNLIYGMLRHLMFKGSK